ncbi:MAG: PilN domain-containing protein [Acidobacteriota bacterium]|nr:PilN domain-containing protein [Acidobacteriota bacterium]MDE3168604.1 PilN domain-containing protein [Acidobacteriota bacterium]
MIRINLLGQVRPKAAKQAVPLEATVQLLFFIVALALALVVIGVSYYQQKRELDATNNKILALTAEKQSLQQVKQDVDRFQSQKAVLQQRIDVIETLQKNRTGAQELLQMVANTVVRVDALWLTSLNRDGSSLTIAGEAGSIDAVANFLTEMKRSGYFDQIELKEAKENDIVPSVETFAFSLTASVAGVQPSSGTPSSPSKTGAPSSAAPPKGRI